MGFKITFLFQGRIGENLSGGQNISLATNINIQNPDLDELELGTHSQGRHQSRVRMPFPNLPAFSICAS